MGLLVLVVIGGVVVGGGDGVVVGGGDGVVVSFVVAGVVVNFTLLLALAILLVGG